MKQLLPELKLRVFSPSSNDLLHSVEFLKVLRQWISPVNNQVPSTDVRKCVFSVLAILNVTRDSLRASDGLPKLLLWFYQHELESEGNRRIIGQTLQSWARMSRTRERRGGGSGDGGGGEGRSRSNSITAAEPKQLKKKALPIPDQKKTKKPKPIPKPIPKPPAKPKSKLKKQAAISRGSGKRTIKPVVPLNLARSNSLSYE